MIGLGAADEAIAAAAAAVAAAAAAVVGGDTHLAMTGNVDGIDRGIRLFEHEIETMTVLPFASFGTTAMSEIMDLAAGVEVVLPLEDMIVTVTVM